MEILFFLLQIIFNFLIPGLLVKLFLDRFAAHLFVGQPGLQWVIALGTGPCLQICTLYYLLWLLPGLWQGFYPLFLFSSELLLLFFMKANLLLETAALKSVIPDWFAQKKYNRILFLAYWIYWIIFVVVNPVAEHDYFEYAIQGKIFFRDAAIPYVPIRYDAISGFCYVGLHGFLLPLFSTLDHFQRFFTGIETDLFFRGITGYYWAMILLFQFHFFRSFHVKLAAWANLVLMLTYG